MIVSTEDPEIAAIAGEYGAGTSYVRPPDLATDDALIYPVLIDAMEWVEEHDQFTADYVLLLQPTSPLRTADDIDNAIQTAIDRDADGVVSVCAPDHHPYWTKRITSDGQLEDFLSLDRPYPRRQELPPAYALNGAIYIARRELMLGKQTFYSERTYAYVMPPERSIDIDSEWDFRLAGLILAGKNGDA